MWDAQTSCIINCCFKQFSVLCQLFVAQLKKIKSPRDDENVPTFKWFGTIINMFLAHSRKEPNCQTYINKKTVSFLIHTFILFIPLFILHLKL